MKFFTLHEANEVLPLIRPELERLKNLYVQIGALGDQVKAAAAASEFGGGMQGGSIYVRSLEDIQQIMADLDDKGIQVKDERRGLIDFPCLLGGRVVLLCWQLGEQEEIEWWHEVEGGFAGRQKLKDFPQP